MRGEREKKRKYLKKMANFNWRCLDVAVGVGGRLYEDA